MAKEEKFTTKGSEAVVAKIQPIFDMVTLLNEKDIEYLKESKRQVKNEVSNIQNVQGVLVDYDKGEAKMQLGAQAIKRINGIIAIWEAVVIDTTKAQVDYSAKEMQKKQIERHLGM